MSPLTRILRVAAATLLLYLPGCAKSDPDDPLAEATKQARSYIEHLQRAAKIPGMAVAVSVNGETVWAQGFGFSDVDGEAPATPQTVFRVGSVSKVLTTAAVARLVDEGRLDLDAPVQHYVPEFPEKDGTITTRQLTGHLSGIRHYEWEETRPNERVNDVIDALEFFKDDPLLSEPGSNFSYSSYAWVLVSVVVQRAAGEPFLDHMKTQVFEPLGMTHTQPDFAEADIPNRSTFYEHGEVAPPADLSYIWAAGGFLSTVEDLLRFGQAFLPDNGFIGAATLQALFTNQKTSDGKATRYGIGWMVDRLSTGDQVYFHGGTLSGGHAALFIRPEGRVVVAMLANHSSRFGLMDCNQIACYFLGQSDCPAPAGEKDRKAVKAEGFNTLVADLNNWGAAMESGDTDRVLATLAREFVSDVWSGRAELEKAVTEGVVPILDDVHVRSSGWAVGDVVRVEDIRVTGPSGETKVIVSFVRTHSGWKVVSIHTQ